MKTESRKTRNDLPQDVLQEIVEGSLAINEDEALKTSGKMYRFIEKLAMPTVSGVENIPAAPCIFVGNHSAFALDAAVIVPVLHKVSGRFVRGMGEAMFFKNPTTRDYFIQGGSIMANPEIGEALLAAGKDILIFPGGSYEATKDLSKRYQVMWKKRTGFVRLAASQGVPIVPFGSVGPEEWYDRYLNKSEVPNSIVGKTMKMLGFSDEYLNSDNAPSIPKGLFGTLLPKPQPVFIRFGTPIPTSEYKGKKLTEARKNAIRDKVKSGVEGCISDMLLLQAQSKEKMGFVRKMLTI